MDDLDIEISQIKNINLIYLYSIDDIFTKNEKKYLGIQIVYDENKSVLKLDYRDPHFAQLLKKVISQYKIEKDKREIILLDDLTEKLFVDEEFVKIADEASSFKSKEIQLFKSNENSLKPFLPYLKEVLCLITSRVEHHYITKIENITGFNKKFVLDCGYGEPHKIPIILYFDDENTLHFKLGAIEEVNVNASGILINDISKISASFKCAYRNMSGTLSYDVESGNVEKSVIINGDTTYHNTQSNEITLSDLDLTEFYFGLFNIPKDGSILKTSDHNFILSNQQISASNSESEIVTKTSSQLSIEKKSATIRCREEKYINQNKYSLTIPIDSLEYTIILKAYPYGGKNFIIIEYATKNNIGKKFDYMIYEVSEFDFYHPFIITRKEVIKDKVKTLSDIEKHLININ